MDRPTYETPNSRVWLLRTGSDSEGQLHEQRVEYLPDSPFPPLHYHPAQDEYFEIESGEMLFVVDGSEHHLKAGEAIGISRRVRHKARNPSGTSPAVVRWETRPALRTGEFLLMAGKLEGANRLQAALLAYRYRDVFRLPGVNSVLLPVVAAIASLFRVRLPEPE